MLTCRLLHKIHNFYRQLNLFDTYSDDPATIHSEKQTTRLFLLLLMIFMAITFVYAAFRTRTSLVEIREPSAQIFLKLSENVDNSITCPCRHQTIQYNRFANFDVSFHAVCSSSFITQTWIDSVYQLHVANFPPNDIRVAISHFWQMIRFLCQLSIDALHDARLDFDASLLLSPSVQPRKLIEQQISSSLNFSLETVISNIQRGFFAARETSLSNGFVSALGTNYRYGVYQTQFGYSALTTLASGFDDGCMCFESSGCKRPTIIFNNEANITVSTIPGMIFDCMISDGVLASSFECVHDQECLNLLELHEIIPASVQSLPVSKRFTIHDTVQTMLSSLMIEELIERVDFHAYYGYCDPSSCVYSYSRRFNIMYIITTMVSAFGGASLVLRLICPVLLKLFVKLRRWIRRKLFHTNNPLEIDSDDLDSRRTDIKQLVKSLWKKITKLNLFKTNSQNEEKVRQQRITTWIFLVTMTVGLTGCSLYWLLSVQRRTIVVENPTQETYQYLLLNHSDTLKCPCQHIAIPYSTFIRMESYFHQICSSKMISPDWYRSLLTVRRQEFDFFDDFRGTLGGDFFRGIHAFCILAKSFMNDAYRLFSSKSYVNPYLQSKEDFFAKILKSIDSFQAATIDDFVRNLGFTRNMIFWNQFFTRTLSNFDIDLELDGTTTTRELSYGMVFIDEYNTSSRSTGRKRMRVAQKLVGNLSISSEVQPREKSPVPGGTELNFNSTQRPRITTTFPPLFIVSCMCMAKGFLCGQYATFSNGINIVNTQINRFLVTRCFITESVLTSAFECWFSPDCIALFHSYYSQVGIIDRFNETLLDPNVESRFTQTVSMLTMMNRLMLENWTSQVFYDKYFYACQPSHCVYSIEERFDWFFVVVSLISVSGAINKALKIILPVSVVVLLFLVRGFKRRKSKISTIEQSPVNQINSQNRTNISWKSTLIQKVFEYNVFETPRSDASTKPVELISTRVYICLVIVVICLLIIYGGANGRTIEVSTDDVSVSSYERLLNRYASTLKCPCSVSPILFDSFIVQLDAMLHPICSSPLISDEFIANFRGELGFYARSLSIEDFRRWGTLVFRYLSSMCNTVAASVNDSISQFKSQLLLSSQLLSKTSFQLQVEQAIEVFQRAAETQFIRILQIFRSNPQINGFISAMDTNYEGTYDPQANMSSIVYQPKTYDDGNCSCATSQTCKKQAHISSFNGIVAYTFDDIYLSCFALDSVLFSSLRCFYQPSCMTDFKRAFCTDLPWCNLESMSYFMPDSYLLIDRLDARSRFTENDTIETITNKFFIDYWTSEISYERYFDTCASSVCTYTYQERWDPLFIVTTFLSLFEGICILLRLLVPICTRWIYRCVKRGR